jgi:hypothetical protein
MSAMVRLQLPIVLVITDESYSALRPWTRACDGQLAGGQMAAGYDRSGSAAPVRLIDQQTYNPNPVSTGTAGP